MELKHCSHDHPLKLQEDQKDKTAHPILCSCCQEQISGPRYSCSDCEFFLHKNCAELPQETKHPMHPRHKLTFISNPHSSSFLCNGCKETRKGFNYNCSLCKFNLCVSCFSYKNQTFNHPLHEHPLNLLKRSISFHCDACDRKHEDLSYKCTACPFWIHRSCGLLQDKIEYAGHKHPLTLGHSIPETYSKYVHHCENCKDALNASYWIYYCGKCRYFVHLNCKKQSPPPRSRLEAHAFEIIRSRLSGLRYDVTKTEDEAFPPRDDDALAKLFRRCIDKNTKNTPQPTEITNWSHEHPLILIASAQDNDDIIKNICDGCVLPIFTPLYTCKDCSYFLHKSCAELPKYKKLTVEDSIRLGKRRSPFSLFNCCFCGIDSNGFFYEFPNGRIDIKCFSEPRHIVHQAHNHKLHLAMISSALGSSGICDSCGKDANDYGFSCYPCRFKLDRRCALLPQIVRHRWDPHPIPLRYPPFDDHPDEFYCDICEEEMDPLKWLYHCTECDQSFHPDCIRPIDKYSNVKFGATFDDEEIHPHPLKYARIVETNDDEPPSPCNQCGERPKDDAALECKPCKFLLCQKCLPPPNVATGDVIWASPKESPA